MLPSSLRKFIARAIVLERNHLSSNPSIPLRSINHAIELNDLNTSGHRVIVTEPYPSQESFQLRSHHPPPRTTLPSSNPMTGMLTQNTVSAPEKLTPAPARSFYQRELPHSCLSFTSDEGKSLFRAALADGHLESFFPLASQLVTQHDPSFCGLATLCTVLNALGVDPKRVWKHPWRWYEQDMLDCCRPLESIRKNGITLAEFNCLARCNGLALTSRSPPTASQENEPLAHQEALEEFRSNVLKATASSSALMVVSFCRSTLGQTGTGHFSPIAGYSREHDRVLVLDVARFKYPSYWVRLEDLYQSMTPLDPASRRPRGYTILSYSPSLAKKDCLTCNPNPPSITRVTLNKSSWAILSRKLSPIIESVKSDSIPVAVQKIVDHVVTVLEIPSPIEIRPGVESEAQEILNKLSSSSDLSPGNGQSQAQTNPLLTLFALAVLPNPRHHSHLLDLKFLEYELDYLRSQLNALGECCSLENNGGTSPDITSCGCKNS